MEQTLYVCFTFFDISTAVKWCNTMKISSKFLTIADTLILDSGAKPMAKNLFITTNLYKPGLEKYIDRVVFILPDEDMKYELIGRAVTEGYLSYRPKEMSEKFDEEIKNIESKINTLNPDCGKYEFKYLEHGQTLLEYVHDHV